MKPNPSAAADLKDELLMWAQELDDSLHGIVRKKGKIISRMGGIPADFGWQMKRAKQCDLLKKAAKALEALSELRTQIEALDHYETLWSDKTLNEDGTPTLYHMIAREDVLNLIDSPEARKK